MTPYGGQIGPAAYAAHYGAAALSHALARDTVDWFRPDANEKMLELRCRIDDDVPVGVSTDATRVRQVLSNPKYHSFQK